MPFEHLNIRSETNLNQFRKSFKIPLTFSSPVKLKLIPPSQTSNLVSQITEFSYKDDNTHGGGLLFYVNQDLNFEVPTNYLMSGFWDSSLRIETFKKKLTDFGTYKPPFLKWYYIYIKN